MAKVNYTCECCGQEFISHRVRNGEKLCADCIEIRRHLRPYVKKLGVGQVLARAGKLLLLYAEQKQKQGR